MSQYPTISEEQKRVIDERSRFLEQHGFSKQSSAHMYISNVIAQADGNAGIAAEKGGQEAGLEAGLHTVADAVKRSPVRGYDQLAQDLYKEYMEKVDPLGWQKDGKAQPAPEIAQAPEAEAPMPSAPQPQTTEPVTAAPENMNMWENYGEQVQASNGGGISRSGADNGQSVPQPVAPHETLKPEPSAPTTTATEEPDMNAQQNLHSATVQFNQPQHSVTESQFPSPHPTNVMSMFDNTHAPISHAPQQKAIDQLPDPGMGAEDDMPKPSRPSAEAMLNQRRGASQQLGL